MNSTPDLFSALPQAEPQWCARLERWITEGAPINLTPGMTVCQMHCMWEAAWTRGTDASAKLERFITRLEDRRRKATRHEKPRLQALIVRAAEMAAFASSLPAGRFLAAQEEFSQTLDLSEEGQDTFWMDVNHRPGIEQTWQLTLQQVIDHIKKNYEPRD